MKRITYLTAAILCLGFVACERTALTEETDMESFVQKVSFSIDPLIADSANEVLTKTMIDPSDFSIPWTPKDTIGVFPSSGSQVYFVVPVDAPTGSASFDGGGWEFKSNAVYRSYYPFVGDIYLDPKKIPVSYKGQKQIGNNNSDFIGPYLATYTSGVSAEDGNLNFAFHHLNTFLRPVVVLPAGEYTRMTISTDADLFVESGTFDLTSEAPVIVADKYSNKLFMDLDITFSQSETMTLFFSCAPSDFTGHELQITIYCKDGSYSYSYSPSKTYQAGHIYRLLASSVVFVPENGIVDFADDNFKTYCVENFDTDSDGEISMSEAKDVTMINVKTDNITSLGGIEHFTNLETLYCYGTWENMEIVRGQLTSLDISRNTALKDLYCNYNQLTSLDVSNNTLLTRIVLDVNPLTSLDVQNNKDLKTLMCRYGGQMTSLVIGENSSLETLDCTFNQLTDLDLSGCTSLTHLYCSSNQLSAIEVSKCLALKSLSCAGNLLSEIDVSKCSALEYLTCSSNPLTTLDVSNNTSLTSLYCHYCPQLSTVDVSKNTALTQLRCDNNPLTTLDVSNNTALKWFRCRNNNLTSLDLSHNTALEDLDCSGNPFGELSLTNNQGLKILVCENNQLNSLDVSSCPALEEIDCNNNNLSSLVLGNNTALTILKCENNNLSGLEVSGQTALQRLFCGNNQITSLDISHNTALIVLNCNNNALTELNVRANKQLVTLNCLDNPLQALYVYPGQNLDLFSVPGSTNIITGP